MTEPRILTDEEPRPHLRQPIFRRDGDTVTMVVSITRDELIIEALRAAHHELTLVNGCTATDLTHGTASIALGLLKRAMDAMDAH